MPKILFFLLILIAATAAYSYTPLKRAVVYKLHISGDQTSSCCSAEDVLRSKGDFDENANIAIFNSEEIDYPKTSLAKNFYQSITRNLSLENTAVLGTTNSAGEEKWIEVSLDEQKLRAWEGSKMVMEFLISSGKWAPTPKGTFNIWYKTRSQSMIGGSKDLGTYYNLPNVPNNMFFYKGYAIHGAYWHNNFGQPMSHGCVNSPLSNVPVLFEWTGPVVPEGQNVVRASADNPGTKVWVH